MAAIKYITRTVSLDGNAITETLPASFFDGEQTAHTFIIDARRGGEPLTLSGAVTGIFLNANDESVPLTGTLVSGVATITLSNACYHVNGRFTLTISVAGAVIYECQSHIRRRSSATAYDPSGVINVAGLTDEVAAMRTATSAANTAAANANAAAAGVTDVIDNTTEILQDVAHVDNWTYGASVAVGDVGTSAPPSSASAITGYRYQYVPVEPDGIIVLNGGTGSSSAKGFTFLDSSYTVLAYFGTGALTNWRVAIPQNCAYVLIQQRQRDGYDGYGECYYGAPTNDRIDAINYIDTYNADRIAQIDGKFQINPDDWNIGNVALTNSGWTPSVTSKTRVCQLPGVSYPLTAGSIIRLTEYSNARFYIGCRRNGAYSTPGQWFTSDYTVPVDGDYKILLANTTDVEQTSKFNLLSLLEIQLSIAERTKLYERKYSNGTGGSSLAMNDGVYFFDASNLSGNENVMIRLYSGSNDNHYYIIKLIPGESRYVYIPQGSSVNYLYAWMNDQSAASDSFTVYKCDNTYFQTKEILQIDRIREGKVPLKEFFSASYSAQGLVTSNTRICSGPYELHGHFTVALSDFTSYQLAVVTISSGKNPTRLNDTGWKSEAVDIYCSADTKFYVNIRKPSNAAIDASEADSIGLSITSEAYSENIATRKDVADNLSDIRKTIASATLRGQCYDHLFVNRGASEITIPHESVYHVRLSRGFGFNIIEANVHATSDGVYVVNHLISNAFGRFFHHVDGSTDISSTLISSVTWDWIVQNVRYNSTISKYQTRPCTLQEFLYECKQQGLMPFIQTGTNAEIIQIADEIMGAGQYIAYGATRDICPNGIIYVWNTSNTSVDQIVGYCKAIGAPMIYGFGNITSFSDSDVQTIINELHAIGCHVGVSYVDEKWYKYAHMGADFNGTQQHVNRIQSGNLHNLNTLTGFENFTFTNATENNGVLTYSSNGSLSPIVQDTLYPVCMIDVELWFDGSISIGDIGELKAGTYTSDGSYPVFFTAPIINGSPKFSLSVTSGTKIFDVKYKASIVS